MTADGTGSNGEEIVTVNYTTELEGYLCVPEGEGPFPVAVYNHGGLGNSVGGPPEDTCVALRAAGYLGFSPMRRKEVPISGHSGDVDKGIAYALAHSKADTTRLAVLGFSRGGYLTFLALTEHTDINVGVIMAPAPVKGRLEDSLDNAANVQASTLVLVAENDLPEFNNENEDHVATATSVYDALNAESKDVTLEVLDAFGDNGHDLFQELRPEYWDRVRAYLADKL